MECVGCGASNRADAAYCARCGCPLVPVRCGQCGAEPEPGARFCDACGGRLMAEARSDVVAIGRRVTAPAAERRSVTVLFADAQGSTALTEQIGDEEAYRMIQGCVGRMTDAVERHGGNVTQFRGDGVMALFGAPVAHEDAAVRAVTAALDMRAALERFREEVHERLGASCPFRIGLNTGPVIVGRVGDETLVDYTAIGDTANVAARMEQAAGPGEVLLAEPTWRAVRDYVTCEEVGALAVKGRTDPVRAWRAVERLPVDGRLDAGAARGLSPLVGRATEVAGLLDAAAEAAAGAGRFVVVTGDAGIGKSRLLLELRRQLPEGTRWYEGRCRELGRATPWLAVTELLRHVAGIDDGDGAAVVRDRIGAVVAPWDVEARADAAPFLRWLLQLGLEELSALPPPQRRVRALAAAQELVRRLAADGLVVLVVEDVHWADEATAATVEAIADAVAGTAALLVATSRPEGAAALTGRADATTLALEELDQSSSAALVDAVAGASLPEPALARIVQRSGGNPLFIEQLTHALVESGGDASDGDLPATIHDVVLARLDRLAPGAREALQLASVIGFEFTRRLLERLAGVAERLDDHLGQLELLAFIRRLLEPSEPAFAFRHALVRQVTYGTVLAERRRRLHREVAEAIEVLDPERLVEHAEVLADHWLEGGDELRALDHLAEAAARAMAGFSMADALAALGTAIEIAERHGLRDRLVALSRNRVDACMLSGDLRGAHAECDRWRAAAVALGDRNAESEALGTRAQIESFGEDFELAMASLEEAFAIGLDAAARGEGVDGAVVTGGEMVVMLGGLGRAAEVPAVEARVAPLLPAAQPAAVATWLENRELYAGWRGRWDETGRAIHGIDHVTRPMDRLWILWTDGVTAAGRGDYCTALHQLGVAIDVAARTGEVQTRARALNTLGWVRFDLGDPAGAVEANHQALELISPRTVWERKIEVHTRINLAEDLTALGQLEAAMAELQPAEQYLAEHDVVTGWMVWRFIQRYQCALGDLLLALGRPQEALAAADVGADVAARYDSPKYAVRARRLRAAALGHLGRLDEARAEAGRAVEEGRALGNPPQLWRALLVAAELGGPGAAAAADEGLAEVDRVVGALGAHPLAEALVASADRRRLVACR